MKEVSIGLAGLAVMGQNLALNIERNGFSIAVYNRTASKTGEFIREKGAGKQISPAHTIKDLAEMCERPRRIILMVKAGSAVDDLIEQLAPHLERGDILIECGNSHFRDTERRIGLLADSGVLYLGTGISGGEEGALNGPSIMPGGVAEAYDAVKPIFLAIAAHVDGEPCCAYMGSGGAGHFVKMVHNGIEYAIMQAIAEVYSLMHESLQLEPDTIIPLFTRWNESYAMGGFLLEIVPEILRCRDHRSGRPLIELIKDTAQQKGTGKWTSQVAYDLGVAVHSISAALLARIVSAYKEERTRASAVLKLPEASFRGDRDFLLKVMADALEASIISAYAQGFSLLKSGSDEFGYGLNLSSIARIWRGGCIIRSKLLQPIAEAFDHEPDLSNLSFSPYFSKVLNSKVPGLREAAKAAIACGVPVPVLSQALSYFDSLAHDILPSASLIQAMRDYFGAHTYERFDMPGVFHTEWNRENHPELVLKGM